MGIMTLLVLPWFMDVDKTNLFINAIQLCNCFFKETTFLSDMQGVIIIVYIWFRDCLLLYFNAFVYLLISYSTLSHTIINNFFSCISAPKPHRPVQISQWEKLRVSVIYIFTSMSICEFMWTLIFGSVNAYEPCDCFIICPILRMV